MRNDRAALEELSGARRALPRYAGVVPQTERPLDHDLRALVRAAWPDERAPYDAARRRLRREARFAVEVLEGGAWLPAWTGPEREAERVARSLQGDEVDSLMGNVRVRRIA